MRRSIVAVGTCLLFVSRCGSDPTTTPKDAAAEMPASTCSASVTAGVACNANGLTCPYVDANGCDAFKSFVCNGTIFYVADSVGPGASCSTAGLQCHWPNTECDGCTCDGTTFKCKENCCTTSCHCPEPSVVAEGAPCDTEPSLTCASEDLCDGGSSASCTCVAGAWSCSCAGTGAE